MSTDHSKNIKLTLALGATVNSSKVDNVDLTFEDLCIRLRERPPVGDKDGTYFVRGPCNPETPSRSDANIISASLLVLDADSTVDLDSGEIAHGAPPPRDVHEVLKRLGIRHVLYTTHSHRNDGASNRFRVLIPATMANKDELEACHAWVFDQLIAAGCSLAPVKENTAWSQPWYFPRLTCADADYEALSYNAGKPLDVAAAVAWHQAQTAVPPEAIDSHAAAASSTRTGDPDGKRDKFQERYGTPAWMLEKLEAAGYTLHGKGKVNDETSYRLLSPRSTTGMAGTILFKTTRGDWCIYSHHSAKDPLSARQSDRGLCDAFDVYVLFDHQGDEHAARTAWARELDPRPVIRIRGGAIPSNVDAVVAALAAKNPPSVFQRAQALCRVAVSEEDEELEGCRIPCGTARIINLERASLTHEVASAARWEKFNQTQQTYVEADPCAKVVGALIEGDGHWNGIPVLNGLSEVPILRADGTLVTEPGYDRASRLYVQGGFPPLTLAETVSRDDCLQAAHDLLHPFREFPFVDKRLDPAVALAYIFTLALRPQLPTAPLIGVSATTPGTGKGLLVEAANVLVCGRDAATMPPVHGNGSEEETRKRITALLSQGISSINMDNWVRPIGGESINVLLTATKWSDRILGQSKTVTLQARTTLAATGNNLTVAGDTVRRALLLQLDANVEKPELRTFEIPDLIGFIRRNRGQLLEHLFTILKGYQQAGAPGAGEKPLGRFEEWTAKVCGPIRWLGFPDPLESQERLREQDPETEKLELLLAEWHGAKADAWMTVGDLIDLSDEYGPRGMRKQHPGLGDALREIAVEKGGEPNRRLLGWFLKRHVGRIAGGCKLERKDRTGAKSKNAQQYRVTKVGGDSGQ